MNGESKPLHLSEEEARRLFESSAGMSEQEKQEALSSMSAREREKAQSRRLSSIMSASSQMGGEAEIPKSRFSLGLGTKGQSGISPLEAGERAGKIAGGVIGAEGKLLVGGTKAVSGAAKEASYGVARGIGMTFTDIFGAPRGRVSPMAKRARGISTVPIGQMARTGSPLKSSGLELLGRDDKVYKLSPVAPSRGVRGAVDYDALEGAFGPQGLFSRDQAVKVLVNIHSSAGQSLYGIVGRFAHMLREGYIVPVEGLSVPRQPQDDSGIYAAHDPHNIWGTDFK